MSDGSKMLGMCNVMLRKAVKLTPYFLQAYCCSAATGLEQLHVSATLIAASKTTSVFDIGISAGIKMSYAADKRSRCALKCSSCARHLASCTKYSRHTCTSVIRRLTYRHDAIK